eukprot:2246606-Alexandrium_andersonii.AAC.1
MPAVLGGAAPVLEAARCLRKWLPRGHKCSQTGEVFPRKPPEGPTVCAGVRVPSRPPVRAYS